VLTEVAHCGHRRDTLPEVSLEGKGDYLKPLTRKPSHFLVSFCNEATGIRLYASYPQAGPKAPDGPVRISVTATLQLRNGWRQFDSEARAGLP
jgi:hypothetical protein